MSIQQTITRSFGRAVLQSKKNSPHIFFAVGLIGVVGSAVMACRATLKLEKAVDDIKADFEEIHLRKHADDISLHPGKYDQNEYVRDLTFAYVRGASKLMKLYGPSVVVGGVSIASLTGSHVQMMHRNAGLAAALAAVSQAYEEYRSRVKQEFGEEAEQAIFQGCLLDDEDDVDETKEVGKVKNGTSPYGRFFDPSNTNWSRDMERNRIFIQCQQNYANHLLNARGHVFLNEIYDQLGFDRSPAGAVVGWVLGGDGDGHIDFDLFNPNNVDFINENSRGCFLDFNVDGVIYEKI